MQVLSRICYLTVTCRGQLILFAKLRDIAEQCKKYDDSLSTHNRNFELCGIIIINVAETHLQRIAPCESYSVLNFWVAEDT